MKEGSCLFSSVAWPDAVLVAATHELVLVPLMQSSSEPIEIVVVTQAFAAYFVGSAGFDVADTFCKSNDVD